ncbi:sensor histidine kinase [Waltera sp.]
MELDISGLLSEEGFMGKLGKETKTLLIAITAVCLISFLLAGGIATLLAKNFQQELLLHDYGVAGHLLNNEKELSISAFTSQPNENDIERGRAALASIGYDETTSMRFLPAVQIYRNQTMFSVFLLLVFLFGAIYLSLFLYLRRQHKAFSNAENTIRQFLDGNTTSRIECSQAGDWYSLFHAINEMATILSAHAENQRQTKEFLQDIISDVSHQIKTPLSALKMYHEIIESHKNDAATVSSFTEKSQREIKRMEDVIYTLLKLARLDAGIIQMEKAPENLSVLMQDVLERFETWAEREHKTITLSGKENVVLSCDALWVSEAIGNIVKNALEHTENGGHIEVKWSQSPLMTQIEISDDGKGIHPEDLYNIFKRFYRSRFSSDVHGIGLGLPLAKSIVEAHGGTISVTSSLGAGTTFTLNFFNLTDE